MGVVTPKYFSFFWWSCDISNESPWKILFRTANIISIRPPIWPSAAGNDLKMAFSDEYLVEWVMSTLNELWSWKLAWIMLYAYIFIICKIVWVGGTRLPRVAQMGVVTTKCYTFWCCHVIHQMKGRENPYSEMKMSCPFDPLFDRKQPKIT